MQKNNTPFLVNLMRYATYLALLSPLYISGKFFFPYVGPKGLLIMGAVQIVFFLWLFLAYHHKKYRPNFDWVTIALLVFFGVMIVSSIAGVDPARSFWSKHERMTGILIWLHLFGFFLAVSSTFSEKDWKRIFTFSAGVATVVGALFLVLQIPGAELPELLRGKGGVTLGNSSFLGTYLLFNGYFVLLLAFHSKKIKRYFAWGAFIIITLALILSSARAAKTSFVAGLGLLALLYLIFETKRKELKYLGSAGLLAGIVGVPLTVFHPQSPVHKWLVEGLGKPRFIVWEQAWEAFKARPILGWGQENFLIAFSKHFNPELLATGAAEWFDRPHNIVFGMLTTKGILGLASYLAVFLALFWVLWQGYKKEKLTFFAAFIPAVLAVTYFVQNLTVFDMPTSLLMFAMLLGFGAYTQNTQREEKKLKHASYNIWVTTGLGVAFLVFFLVFVVQPFRANALVIESLKTQNPNQRIATMEKCLESSPLGKYQIRAFFAQNTQQMIQQALNQNSPEDISQEIVSGQLDFSARILEKTKEQSPLDYKSQLTLSQTYNLHAMLDPEKIDPAVQTAEEATEVSPANPKGHTSLAQAYLQKGEVEKALAAAKKAVELEPRYAQSQFAAIQVARQAGAEEELEKLTEQAVQTAQEWIDEEPENNRAYKFAGQIAQVSQDIEFLTQLLDQAQKNLSTSAVSNLKSDLGLEQQQSTTSTSTSGESGVEIETESGEEVEVEPKQ